MSTHTTNAPAGVAVETLQQRGSVSSIASRLQQPDTQRLSMALQTTLDLEEQLAIFSREVWGSVQHTMLIFRRHQNQETLILGRGGRHRANYMLDLEQELLGQISISRATPFNEFELASFEYLLCSLIYPLRNALRYRMVLEQLQAQRPLPHPTRAEVVPLTAVETATATTTPLPAVSEQHPTALAEERTALADTSGEHGAASEHGETSERIAVTATAIANAAAEAAVAAEAAAHAGAVAKRERLSRDALITVEERSMLTAPPAHLNSRSDPTADAKLQTVPLR